MEYYAIGSSDGKSAIMDGADIEYAGSMKTRITIVCKHEPIFLRIAKRL
jgi:hypothetical protein